MINPQIAKSLCYKLPLIVARMEINDLILLKHKWGGVDGLYHSINHILNVAKFETTKERIVKVEDEAIILIENELNLLFCCSHCSTDLRKCGVIFIETCLNKKNIYINNEGIVSRSNEEKIIPQNFQGQPSRTYACVNCNYNLNKLPIEAILEDGLNNNTIKYYISRCYPGNESNLSKLFSYQGRKSISIKNKVMTGLLPMVVNPDNEVYTISAGTVIQVRDDEL